jgi:hypothetical protein
VASNKSSSGKADLSSFTEQAIITVTESAANTLTFAKLTTGVSIYDKIGWIINRLEWRFGGSLNAFFNGTADSLALALTMSNAAASLSDTDPAIIAIRRWQRTDFGTAANAQIQPLTWVDDFSTLPGGGLLVLPNPIYGAALGSGLTTASTTYIRMFFTPVELSDQDYFNLVQARQLLIST